MDVNMSVVVVGMIDHSYGVWLAVQALDRRRHRKNT